MDPTPTLPLKIRRRSDRCLDMLRRLKRDSRLSYSELSAAIKEITGRPISKSTVYDWLRRGSRPSSESAQLLSEIEPDLEAYLAERYRVSIDSFLELNHLKFVGLHVSGPSVIIRLRLEIPTEDRDEI